MTSLAALTVHNCIYLRPASVRTQLDGDTFRCQSNIHPIVPDSDVWIPKVRVVKINAPETGQLGAEEARTALVDWLSLGPFDLACYGRDKYGRLLGDAVRDHGFLSNFMLEHDFVVPMKLETARALLDKEHMTLAYAVAHPSFVAK